MMQHLKNFLLASVVVMLFTIVFAGFARAGSMAQYCVNFNDSWFTNVTHNSERNTCSPSSTSSVTVRDVEFMALLTVGFPDTWTTRKDIDRFLYGDYEGTIPFGTSRTVNDEQQEFKEISLGDSATRASRNRQISGAEISGQDVTIQYAIRVGLCYATIKVLGIDTSGSPFYFGFLSDEIDQEANVIAKKLKEVKACETSTPAKKPTAPAPPPAPPPELPKPGKEEVEKFAQDFGTYTPPADAESPAPALPSLYEAIQKYKSNINEEAKHIKEIKKCPGSPLPSQNPCVAEGLAKLLPYVDESTDVISAGEIYGYDGPKDRPIIIDFVDGEMPDEFPEWTFGALWIDASYENLVVLDADSSAESKIIYEPQMSAIGQWKPLSKDLEIESSSFVVTDQKSVRLANGSAVMEIGPQSGVYVAGSGADDTQYDLKFGAVGFNKADDGSVIEVRTPLTITKSKHTQFVVLYDPEKQSAATAIYQGEVEVTDRLTGETVTLTPTDSGKPRVLIAPLTQDDAFPLIWLGIAVLLVGTGFWLYKKGIFKKLISRNPQI